MPVILVGQSKGKKIHMSDNEIPKKESKNHEQFLFKNSCKTPKFGSMARMALEVKIIPFFNNYGHHGRHIQVHK